MMLGRAARSFAAVSMRRTTPAILKQPSQVQVARRNAGSMPSTLSVRMDGLFIQCCIAAVIHFVPQDLIFLGGVLYMTHATASAKSPKTTTKDHDAAVEAFKAKKGLEQVKYSKGYVTL